MKTDVDAACRAKTKSDAFLENLKSVSAQVEEKRALEKLKKVEKSLAIITSGDCDKVMEDSSDDEDLPVGLTPLKIEKSFSENDIVWVRWKQWPYLPSLVKKVYKGKKRLTLAVFCPTGFEEDFTMGYGNRDVVIPYCDSRRDRIMAEAEELNKTDREYFNASLAQAENFITKEALKHLEKTALVKENLEDENEREPDKSKEQGSTSRKKRKLLDSTDYNHRTAKVQKNGHAKRVVNRIEKQSEKTRPLTNFLVSEKTKDHLRKIFFGDIPSELHDRFLSCSIRERAKMKHRGFGPIDDDEQIELLLSTYLTWLQEINNKPIHEVNYIFDVWVPEAVVFALKTLKGYSKKRAWEQFDKGVRRNKDDLRKLHEEMKL